MNIISFLLDICPVVGGLKMTLEACFKKDLTGTELVGKARGIHFLFGIISLIADFFTVGLLGSFGRGLFKIFEKGFIRRLTVMAAKKAGRGTATRAVLRGAGRTIGAMEKNVVGRGLVRGAEKNVENRVKNKFDVKKYRRNEDNYRQQVRGEEPNNPTSRREILDRQRLENPKQQNEPSTNA